MAELSELLMIRIEKYNQQQQEVGQLRTQVMKLQHCCQLVRECVCVCEGFPPVRPQGTYPPPPPARAPSSARPKDPVQVRIGVGGDLRETPILFPCPKDRTKVFQELGSSHPNFIWSYSM